MGASDAGTETPEDSSFSEGLKRYSRTSRWTQLSQYMAWLLITINRHLQRTHCFQLWEPTIDMAHVKDVPIYITKKASADRFSIFYRAEGPDQASRRDAQPAPKWSCSAGDWGAASTSKKDIRSHGRMSFFRKCIDTCPACYVFPALVFLRFLSSGYSLTVPKERDAPRRILHKILSRVK